MNFFRIDIFFLLILLITGCKNEQSLFTKSSLLLGTQVNITIIAKNDSEAVSVTDKVFAEIARIEAEMSPVKENSDIYRINHRAFNELNLNNETYDLIARSIQISNDTAGTFDVTFATVGSLWDFKKDPFVPPSKDAVLDLLKYTGYKNIKLYDGKIKFANNFIRMGLGGIAKGYAVKRSVDILRQNGISNGIVDAGGDLQVIGNKFGTSWKAGLQNPRPPSPENNLFKNIVIMIIPLNDGDSIVTSGDYERFTFYENERYHHIIDTSTGYPAKTVSSVTVISQDPVEADAYATAIFVMGVDKAKVFAKTKKVDIIMIDLQMNIFATDTLKSRLVNSNENIENVINWF